MAVINNFIAKGEVSRDTVGAYYREYRSVEKFLCDKHLPADHEYWRTFLSGFSGHLLEEVELALKIKFLNQLCSAGYLVEDVLQEILKVIREEVSRGLMGVQVHSGQGVKAVLMKTEMNNALLAFMQNQQQFNKQMLTFMAKSRIQLIY